MQLNTALSYKGNLCSLNSFIEWKRKQHLYLCVPQNKLGYMSLKQHDGE